jgi:uncharacterized membrane protein YgdD (TMEM256/DUF423 family)
VQGWLWILTGVNGFLAVALGAFGAHGLERSLAGVEAFERRMAWWQTASQYHLTHALALAVAAVMASKEPSIARVAGLCFQCGILLFSGSLYTMTLSGARWLGAVTPLGGLAFLAGWAAVAVAGYRWTR